MPQKSRKKKFAAAKRRPNVVAAASQGAAATASAAVSQPWTAPASSSKSRLGGVKGQSALPHSAAAANVGRELGRIAVLSLLFLTAVVVIAFLIR